MIKSIFCKHDWIILSEEYTKSPIEILNACGATSVKGLRNATERKFIQIVACKTCGKLKRFVEEL